MVKLPRLKFKIAFSFYLRIDFGRLTVIFRRSRTAAKRSRSKQAVRRTTRNGAWGSNPEAPFYFAQIKSPAGLGDRRGLGY